MAGRRPSTLPATESLSGIARVGKSRMRVDSSAGLLGIMAGRHGVRTAVSGSSLTPSIHGWNVLFPAPPSHSTRRRDGGVSLWNVGDRAWTQSDACPYYGVRCLEDGTMDASVQMPSDHQVLHRNRVQRLTSRNGIREAYRGASRKRRFPERSPDQGRRSPTLRRKTFHNPSRNQRSGTRCH